VTSFFAPALRQLLCAWRSRQEALPESLQAAEDWRLAAQDSLRWLRPLILWTAASEENLRQAELDLKEVKRLLDDSKAHTKVEGADLLRQVLERYYVNLFKIQAQEEERPAFSPLLPLDQLIRVAFNLLQARCEPLELQSRFAPAQAAVAEARANLDWRPRLFDDTQWPDTLYESLYQMEGGMGALAQFLETGEPKVLEESIQLLGKGSTDYVEALKTILQALVPRYSGHDDLECWLRLQAYPYDLGPELVEQLWNRLYARVDAFFRVVQMVHRSGLGVAQPDALTESAPLHQRALDLLGELSQSPLTVEQQVEKLKPVWDDLARLESFLTDSLSQVQAGLKESPGMTELLEILGQAESGILPLWVVRHELETRLAKAEAAHQALQEASESGAVPDNGATVLTLLASHPMAYQRLLLFCDDENVEHLVEGWRLLALTLPPLLQFDQQIRSEVAQKGRSGQQVTCVRCGEIQPVARVCRSCGAALPQMQIDDVRYEDISGADGLSQSDSASDYLVELARGIPFGSSTWDDLRLEIVAQLKGVEATRERFERELLNMMGKEAALDMYCQFFIVRLGQLSQTLMSLGESAQRANIVSLQGGLSAYEELHRELQEFQKRIDEGLKKTKP